MARGRFTSVLGLQSARCAGGAARDGRLRRLQPLMRVALLATAGVLFAFQRRRILAEPLVSVLIAVPILIQVYFNGGAGIGTEPRVRRVASDCCIIGADRCKPLLRAGRRRARRGARDVVGRAAREPHLRMVAALRSGERAEVAAIPTRSPAGGEPYGPEDPLSGRRQLRLQSDGRRSGACFSAIEPRG